MPAKFKGSRSAWVPSRRLNYRPDRRRVLSAVNEFHAGQITFERKSGIWSVTSADDCLAFASRLDPAAAKLELARRGYALEWLPLNFPVPSCSVAGVSSLDNRG